MNQIPFTSKLLHSWWVVAFILVCLILYERSLENRDRTYQMLSQQKLQLLQKKEQEVLKQHDLLMQIASQNDPAWMELTLIKELGLVPEGTMKVYFQESK